MKVNNIISLLPIFFLVFLIGACEQEPPLGGSRLDTNTPELTELDGWLRATFTEPYNIEINYRWNENEVDRQRYLFPPTPDRVRPAMELVNAIWIEPYTKVGGDVVKKIAPRIFFLVGGKNISSIGQTRVLGQAEGGKKVVLFEVDFLNVKSHREVSRFLHTIQHEYVHILNQTKPFDEATYGNITPGGYTAGWYNFNDSIARSLGFITPYSRANLTEDFAEMASTMLSMTKADFDAIVEELNADARESLREKEAMVADYYRRAFGIDIYVLQREVALATENITE